MKKTKRCPYCRLPEPNNVIGLHNCVWHECPKCHVTHHRNMKCADAVDAQTSMELVS